MKHKVVPPSLLLALLLLLLAWPPLLLLLAWPLLLLMLLRYHIHVAAHHELCDVHLARLLIVHELVCLVNDLRLAAAAAAIQGGYI
jgi:hypothetical protein